MKNQSIKQRVMNILVAIDQLFQTILYLGKYNPDITISQVLGVKKQKGILNLVEKVLCYTLTKLEAHHCINSIETDENMYN